MSESLSDYNNNGKVIFGNVLGNVILKNAAKIINVFRTKDYLVLTMIDKHFSSELVQWVFFPYFIFALLKTV